MPSESTAFNASWLALMLLGLGAMVWLHCLLLRRSGQKRRMAWLTPLLGLVPAALLSKLLCLVFRFDLFNSYGAAALLRMNPQEFSFVGGCLGFVLGAVFAALVSRERILPALDTFAAPACLMAAVARAAEGFLGDLNVGDFVDAEAFQFFPVAVQDEWGGWVLALFMLAAIAAAVCGLCAGGWLEKYRTRPGLCFERTVVGLCAGQLMFEILRVVYIELSFVHTEQVLCAIPLVIILLRHCILLLKRHRRRAWLPVCIVLLVLFVGWQILLQFAMDKSDYLIDPLPLSEPAMDWLKANLAPVCHSLMALGVAVLLVFEWLSARAYLKPTPAESEADVDAIIQQLDERIRQLEAEEHALQDEPQDERGMQDESLPTPKEPSGKKHKKDKKEKGKSGKGKKKDKKSKKK